LRVFFKALRYIAVGEELFFDYALMIEGRKTAKVRKEHACFCGAQSCRGTMLVCKK
jgi:SET domain-containing protein